MLVNKTNNKIKPKGVKIKSLEGKECPTVDIEIYNKRKKRDCSETIKN